MSKVQVLVTTMNQLDDRKYEEMNLQTDAVIANQADFESCEIRYHGDCVVNFVSTKTKGLSKNRNIAIENISSDAEYIVFSDDDLILRKGYEDIILNAFAEHPDVDAMHFNLCCVGGRKMYMKQSEKYHLANRREVGSWGVCGLAIKKSVLTDHHLCFNERFGSGTDNYCGEDTIFLQELFKQKIKIGCMPIAIADIDQSKSTWFEGFDSKYFTTAGAVLHQIYPLLCYPLSIRSALRAAKIRKSQLPFGEILKCYFCGIKKNIKEKKDIDRKRKGCN